MNTNIKIAIASAALLLLVFFGYRHFSTSAGDQDAAPLAKSASKAEETEKPSTPEPATAPRSQPATIAQSVSVDDDPVGTLFLEGQAVDEEGNPVPGATIILRSAPPRTTLSEEDGTFSFENLIERQYAVYARSADKVGGPAVVSLTEKSPPVLVHMQSGGGIEVEVFDEEAAPIAGASVTVASLRSIHEQTDAKGIAVIRNLPAGGTLIAVSAPGYAKAASYVTIPSSGNTLSHQRFTLHTGVQITGRVVDENGVPIANAKIISQDVNLLFAVEDPREDGVTSDAKGGFSLPAVANGTVQLLAVHDDFAPTTGERFTVGDSPISDIELTMTAGAKIAGSVLSAEGAPQPWATVQIYTAPDSQKTPMHRQMISDADGTFSMKGLPRARLVVTASSDEASSRVTEIDLRNKETVTDLKITLDVTGTISGVVVDEEGEAIAEAQVQASVDFWEGADMKDMQSIAPAFAMTDGDGAFVLRGLADSKYRIVASRSLGSQQSSLAKSTKAATGDTGIRIVLATPGTVTGSITMSNGQVPKIAAVSLGFGAQSSAEEGAFQLNDVPPGTYELTVRGPEFATTIVPRVKVETGTTLDLGAIQVERGRKISGRVVDRNGAAAEGAIVVLAKQLISDGKNITPKNIGDSISEQQGRKQSTTNASGEYEFFGVGPEETTMVAEGPVQGRSLAVAVPKGSEDLQIPLPLVATGSISGVVRVKGKGQANISILIVSPTASSHIIVVNSSPDGSFLAERVAIGDYKLSAMLGSGASASMTATNLTVTEDSETKANLEVTEGSVTFVVTIAGKEGVAIDAAQIFVFRGAANVTKGAELTKLFLSAAENAKMTFAMGSAPATFEKMQPGNYSVCVIPINGDMSDPTFQQRLQRNVDELAVHCQQVQIKESPETQPYTATVPAMLPLPE